jgi:hypothetical protein
VQLHVVAYPLHVALAPVRPTAAHDSVQSS